MPSHIALPFIVGIGSSGRRAIKFFIEKGIQAKYAIVSNSNLDRSDQVEFFDFKEGEKLGLNPQELSIIISSLAGNTGPYISHHVAASLKESGSFVISIVYPPFPFEEIKKFRASNALRRLSKTSDLVLLVNNEFYLKKAGRLPLDRYYREVNEELSVVVDYLINDAGMVDRVKALGGGLAIVSASWGGNLTDNIARLVTKVFTVAGRIEEGISFISGNPVPSPKDMEKTYKGLSLIEGKQDVRAAIGMRSAATIVKVGEVELMNYDPVARILGDRVLDVEPEVRLSIALPIDRID